MASFYRRLSLANSTLTLRIHLSAPLLESQSQAGTSQVKHGELFLAAWALAWKSAEPSV